MKQIIFVLLLIFLLITILSGCCNQANGSAGEVKEEVQEIVECDGYGFQNENVVHKGFKNFWMRDYGTVVEYSNGERYEYSVAVRCRYSKKKISLQ